MSDKPTPLIINADDFGLTVGVSKCIVELLELGAVSTTTVMMCSEGIDTVLQRIEKQALHGRAGVHLQLTNGRPLTRGSSLTDPANERHFRGRDAVGTHLPDDVYAEWEAQILSFQEKFGFMPTHLDTHHGFHRNPRYTDIYLELATRFDLAVRGGEEPFLTAMRKARVRGSTLFVRKWSLQVAPLVALLEQLSRLKSRALDDDAIEVTTHPGFVDRDLKMASSAAEPRDHERRMLEELAASNWVNDHGFSLIGFAQLIRSS